MPRPREPASPFRYFNSSPEVIRLVVMMYVRFPLSLRNVEDLLFERGVDLYPETVRMFAGADTGPARLSNVRLRPESGLYFRSNTIARTDPLLAGMVSKVG